MCIAAVGIITVAERFTLSFRLGSVRFVCQAELSRRQEVVVNATSDLKKAQTPLLVLQGQLKPLTAERAKKTGKLGVSMFFG